MANSNPRGNDDEYRRLQICSFLLRVSLYQSLIFLVFTNEKEASTKKTKRVNHAFDELEKNPDVYRQFLKKGQYLVTDSQLSDPTVNFCSLVAATENELAATKQNITEEIKKN